MPPVRPASCARRSRRTSALVLGPACSVRGEVGCVPGAAAARAVCFRLVCFFLIARVFLIVRVLGLRRAINGTLHEQQTAPGGLAAAGCGIPRRYQAAFRVGTAFAAISWPNWLNFAWISD